MPINHSLNSCFVQEETFKPKCLNGEEIKMRELNLAQNLHFRELLFEKKDKEAMYFALKCAMIEPEFFKDEELKNLNATGEALLYELYMYLPVLGKSQLEKDKYYENIKKEAEHIIQDEEIKEDARKELKKP